MIVRPTQGEHVEIYLRRLARANHLKPSYLRQYAAGPPRWTGKLDPERVAVLGGRPVHDLQRTLIGLGGDRPKRVSGRIRRKHDEKPTLFVEIREAAKAGYNKKELMRTFHVGRATLLQALEAPTPRPWRSPFKKNPPAYVAVIEEIRETHPELNPVQIWMAIINGTEVRVSRATVENYLRQPKRP